jgi:hypothetical protein
MTAEEQAAVQKSNRAEEMRTALAVGAGGTGGFAIPIVDQPVLERGHQPNPPARRRANDEHP